jgi:tyrosyl-tRNA synthetase
MTAFKSDFLNVLQQRGFIHQCSDFEGLDALAAKGEANAYVGCCIGCNRVATSRSR